MVAELEALALDAERAWNLGALSEVESMYRRLVHANPSNAAWRLLLARVCKEQGKDSKEMLCTLCDQAIESGDLLVAMVSLMEAGDGEIQSDLLPKLRPALSQQSGLESAQTPMPLFNATALDSNVSDSLPRYQSVAPHNSIPFFSHFSLEELQKFKSAVSLRMLPAKTTLLTAGQSSDVVYIVAAGEFEAIKVKDGEEVQLATLKPTAIIGEMSLVLDRQRATTIRSTTPSFVLRVCLSSVRDIAAQNSHAAMELKNFRDRRAMSILLATSPLFQNLHSFERAMIVQCFRSHEVQQGEKLMSPKTRMCFLVFDGVFEVLTRIENSKSSDSESPEGFELSARLGPGDVFGESLMLESGEAGFVIRALTPGRLLELPQASYVRLCGVMPNVESARQNQLNRLMQIRQIQSIQATMKARDDEVAVSAREELQEKLDKAMKGAAMLHRFIFEDDEFVDRQSF